MENVLCIIFPQQLVHATNGLCCKKRPDRAVDPFENLYAINCNGNFEVSRGKSLDIVSTVALFAKLYGYWLEHV